MCSCELLGRFTVPFTVLQAVEVAVTGTLRAPVAVPGRCKAIRAHDMSQIQTGVPELNIYCLTHSLQLTGCRGN